MRKVTLRVGIMFCLRFKKNQAFDCFNLCNAYGIVKPMQAEGGGIGDKRAKNRGGILILHRFKFLPCRWISVCS
jgi:hypothetical protein